MIEGNKASLFERKQYATQLLVNPVLMELIDRQIAGCTELAVSGPTRKIRSKNRHAVMALREFFDEITKEANTYNE